MNAVSLPNTIDEFIFDISYPHELSNDYQEKNLSNFLVDTFLPLVDREIFNFFGDDSSVVIDRLELNFGDVSHDAFLTEVVEQTPRLLQEALTSAGIGNNDGIFERALAQKSVSTEINRMRAFILEGRLRYSVADDSKTHVNLLENLLRKPLQSVIDLFLEIVENPTALLRTVRQFGEAELRQIVQMKLGNEYVYLISRTEKICDFLIQKNEWQLSQQHYFELVWSSILKVAFGKSFVNGERRLLFRPSTSKGAFDHEPLFSIILDNFFWFGNSTHPIKRATLRHMFKLHAADTLKIETTIATPLLSSDRIDLTKGRTLPSAQADTAQKKIQVPPILESEPRANFDATTVKDHGLSAFNDFWLKIAPSEQALSQLLANYSDEELIQFVKPLAPREMLTLQKLFEFVRGQFVSKPSLDLSEGGFRRALWNSIHTNFGKEKYHHFEHQLVAAVENFLQILALNSNQSVGKIIARFDISSLPSELSGLWQNASSNAGKNGDLVKLMPFSHSDEIASLNQRGKSHRLKQDLAAAFSGRNFKQVEQLVMQHHETQSSLVVDALRFYGAYEHVRLGLGAKISDAGMLVIIRLFDLELAKAFDLVVQLPPKVKETIRGTESHSWSEWKEQVRATALDQIFSINKDEYTQSNEPTKKFLRSVFAINDDESHTLIKILQKDLPASLEFDFIATQLELIESEQNDATRFRLKQLSGKNEAAWKQLYLLEYYFLDGQSPSAIQLTENESILRHLIDDTFDIEENVHDSAVLSATIKFVIEHDAKLYFLLSVFRHYCHDKGWGTSKATRFFLSRIVKLIKKIDTDLLVRRQISWMHTVLELENLADLPENPTTSASQVLGLDFDAVSILIQLKNGAISVSDLDLNSQQWMSLVEKHVFEIREVTSDSQKEFILQIKETSEHTSNATAFLREVVKCLVDGKNIDLEECSNFINANSLSTNIEQKTTIQLSLDAAKESVEYFFTPEGHSSISPKQLELIEATTVILNHDFEAEQFAARLKLAGLKKLSTPLLEKIFSLLPSFQICRIFSLIATKDLLLVEQDADILLALFLDRHPEIAPKEAHYIKWQYLFEHALNQENLLTQDALVLGLAGILLAKQKHYTVEEISALQKNLSDEVGVRRRAIDQTYRAAKKARRGVGKNKPLLDAAEQALVLDEVIYLDNAGLVLASPYLPRLFSTLGLTNTGQFVSAESAERAVHLLEYLVNKRVSSPEYQLSLNKLICGVKFGVPISRGIDITINEVQIIEGMIQAMIANWKTIGNTSVAGFRESFLQRKGSMFFDEDKWQLNVQAAPFDMLLDRLPWSFSVIKFPWMHQPIHVKWRN
ncbi:MAG: hypothetical protein K2Y28_03425 [Burkholderiaceae bacterium]|nr:hypothetical protein [Burkholderiaceae bacterium]